MRIPLLGCAGCGLRSLSTDMAAQQPLQNTLNVPVRPAAIPNTTYAQAPVIPRVRGVPQLLGLAMDPSLNRDSCGSSQFGDRVLWTCRDTQFYNSDGSVQRDPTISSTASWSDYGYQGGPNLRPLPAGADPLKTDVLELYGRNTADQGYFPLLPFECDTPTGNCPDGTRYAIWPDQPPMVTETRFPNVRGYTWIKQSHIRGDFSAVEPNPATTLYRIDYSVLEGQYNDQNVLPRVTVVKKNFYQVNEIPFGDYGNVVENGTAYLYAQINRTTALAKVPADHVEDQSKYEYFVNGKWTHAKPSINHPGLDIPNSNNGGQGTYYFSKPWRSYVWIGGDVFPGARVYVCTAPKPEGPWTKPKLVYHGPEGDYSLSAYSVQAHPGLTLDPRKNEIYVTYTKNDLDKNRISSYTTPLVYIQWE